MRVRVRGWKSFVFSQIAIGVAATLVSLGVLLFLTLTDDVGIPAAIVTAAVPVSLGLMGQSIASDRQNKRQIEAKLREKK
jgi:hypothetical protein